MADQRIITLWAGDATPSSVVLQSLPLWEPVPNSPVYSYPVTQPVVVSSPDPRTIILWTASTAASLGLEAVYGFTLTAPRADITLLMLPGPDTGGAAPPIAYYAVLRRWTGATWAKAELKVNTGSWVAKPLKVRAGAAWELVDATG